VIFCARITCEQRLFAVSSLGDATEARVLEREERCRARHGGHAEGRGLPTGKQALH